MKIDVTKLIGKYIVFSETNDSHPVILGPITAVSQTQNSIILSTGYDDIEVYVDENLEAEDVLFITKYMYRALLYKEQYNLR